MEGSKQYALNDYAQKIIRYKAKQLAGKYGFTRDDHEDLCQEMTLDLLVRLPKFNPGKASLNTFIARVVDRKVANLIRFQRQAKRDYRREAPSLNGLIEDGEGHIIPRGETISQDEHDRRTGKYTRAASEREDLRLDAWAAISALPWDLQRLAKLLMTHSIAEAARELGMPRGTLCGTHVVTMRETFGSRGLGEYLQTSRRLDPRPGKYAMTANPSRGDPT
jgi:RNA polymerase sigma-70 factor, ECF subfamily